MDGEAAARRLLDGLAMIDPAGLQVLAAALRGVAEEMGAALVRSAFSANIKERRDCSTALFDARGRMIVQADVYYQGQKYGAKWSSPDRGSPLVFTTDSGQPIALPTGLVWVDVVPG